MRVNIASVLSSSKVSDHPLERAHVSCGGCVKGTSELADDGRYFVDHGISYKASEANATFLELAFVFAQ